MMIRALAAVVLAVALAGCSTASHPPLALAGKVDLARFMGDWYVIASIPTFIEKDAYAAVESYRLAPDGRIETTFTFRAGGFDGAAKRYTPVATVADPATNAVWRMQFLWPFAADYRIVHVAPDYSSTVVARERRDYAWIMARAPALPEAEFAALAALLRAQGYDTTKLRKVPQRPS
jgi:apolipoprotein D and lipocalin family protein